MKELHITKNNLDELLEAVQDALEKEPHLVIEIKGMKTGKWGMSRLWRTWMATTAKHMAGLGVTMPLMITKEGANHGTRPFNADDAHELFSMRHLQGIEGERLSWSKSGRDGMRAATKGERFHCLRQHEVFCVERGITLLKPRDSDYVKLSNEGGY